jgi:hypothetical protein
VDNAAAKTGRKAILPRNIFQGNFEGAMTFRRIALCRITFRGKERPFC